MGIVGLRDGCMTCIRCNRIYGTGYNRSPDGALFAIIFIHIEISSKYGRMDEYIYLQQYFMLNMMCNITYMLS
jgi:hypothetical protein